MQEKAQIIYMSQFILLTIYFKRDTSKDLLHKIGFKFGMFNFKFPKINFQ